jgi:hypothetical protein
MVSCGECASNASASSSTSKVDLRDPMSEDRVGKSDITDSGEVLPLTAGRLVKSRAVAVLASRKMFFMATTLDVVCADELDR